METIKSIYRIGYGPSSSHTMGPKKAAEIFLAANKNADRYIATLYGSLAATGKGHLTDVAIESVFADRDIEIVWRKDIVPEKHTNALKFEAIKDSATIAEETFYSIGGGKIISNSIPPEESEKTYPFDNLSDILKYCNKNGMQLWQVVFEFENQDIKTHLKEVWQVMQESIQNGLTNEGTLPGAIKLPRKALATFSRANSLKSSLRRLATLFSYALAVSEENAGGGKIVTAPTCGSCGVLN